MKFINSGMPVFKARKTSMLIYAFFVLPIVFAQILGDINMWLAVMVIGLAAAAHQAWSANIFTTVSDMFPKKPQLLLPVLAVCLVVWEVFCYRLWYKKECSYILKVSDRFRQDITSCSLSVEQLIYWDGSSCTCWYQRCRR